MTLDWTPPWSGRTPQRLLRTRALTLLKPQEPNSMRRVLLGHSSIQTTQRYQHLESSDVSPKAAAILNQQNAE